MLLWVLLAVVLVICTFGLTYAVSFVISAFILCTIAFASLRLLYLEESDTWWTKIHHSNINRNNFSDPCDFAENKTLIPEGEKQLTGSNIIDEQLNLIVKYILRDFVIGWYSNISGHPDFVVQVQVSLQQVLISIANRCKSADWVGYLTKQFVDDIVNHLKLFRGAKAAVKCKKGSTEHDIISNFFEREVSQEKDVRRESLCMDKDAEIDYLSDLVEVLLYFFMPSDDFENIPLRSAIVEILVSTVLLPLVDRISHQHYVNSLIVLAGSDFPITSDLYLTVVRTSTSSNELEAVKKSVLKEISHLRSKDCSGREQGHEARQQIGSLQYLRQVIDTQLRRLDKGAETDSIGLPTSLSYSHLSRANLFQLPLDAILKNSLTLDHFLRYMDSIGCQHYVNLYLNIECWKMSVSEHLCVLELERIHSLQVSPSDGTMPDMCHDYFTAHDLSSHKAEAEVIYDLYLSEKAVPRVAIDDSILKRVILTLRTENISENWFDEVQQFLFTSLKDIDSFLPAFKRSDWYIRLLAELDLLKDAIKSEEDDSHSLDDLSATGSDTNIGSNDSPSNQSPSVSHHPSPCHSRASSLSNKTYTLSAYIFKAEIVRAKSRSHAVYRINVTQTDHAGYEDVTQVVRRYSEFHECHSNICAKFMDLSAVPFPSKKMRNNLAAWFLEKRMLDLNCWLMSLMDPPVLHSHPGLQEEFVKFFHQSNYLSQPSTLATKVKNNLVTPIGTGVRSVSDAVKSVPDTVFNTVDVLYRRLNKPSPPPKGPFGGQQMDINQKASFDIESEENIPLRIVLPLMDEIFDLGSKDQWFRRRIILFLRQILKAIFGDIVNRKIIDYVEYITSSEQVSEYIRFFKDAMWPGGKLAPPLPETDEDHQLKTKVAARACLLGCISDEFKAILGSQTTSRGVLHVFECVQWQPLNKRLIYVLFTGIIETVFTSQTEVRDILRSLISTSRKHKKQPSASCRTGRPPR